MCYSGSCIREFENCGTCKDPRKCLAEELEADRQAALCEVDDLQDFLMKDIAAMTSRAEHVECCSVFEEVRSLAKRIDEALECLIDEVHSALRDAHEALGE